MPIQVVFSLLGVEFDGSRKALLPFHGPDHVGIIQCCVKEVGLTTQFRGGVGVGIRDQQVSVQGRDEPVHGRVGRKARFKAMDVKSEVLKAFLDGVEAGFRSEKGKPRGPDMSRYEHCVFAGLQRDFQEVMGIQSQDGPPVRGDVPYPAKPFLKTLHRRHVGHEDEVMHLPGFSILLVDAADLSCENKACGAGATGRDLFFHPLLKLRGQLKETLFRLHQLFSKFGSPGRMGEIPRADHGNPFFPGPEGELFRIKAF